MNSLSVIFNISFFLVIIHDARGIKGGYHAEGIEFNYHVSIQSFLGSHICSGGIIDKNHIITAAHCVSHHYPAALRTVSGVLNLNTLYLHGIRSVREIHIPEGYFEDVHLPENATRRDIHCRYYNNDIAVLTLFHPLLWIDATGMLVLPRTNFTPCSAAVFSGWTANESDEDYQPRLKWMHVVIYPTGVCRTNSAYHAADQFCSRALVNGASAIPGDSGGPLVADGTVIGIMSGICEDCRYYSFTNVYLYRDYITNIISQFIPTNPLGPVSGRKISADCGSA